MISPATWLRARAIFERAADLDRASLGAFLERTCGDDRELREAVHALLAGDRGQDALDTGARRWIAEQLVDAGEERWLGRRLGPYRISGRLGRGGMGTVFEAVRDDRSFEKTVAVKVMRVGLGDGDGRLRFARERRILARLEHPGIARLLDGGETEDGTPWLAMERIDGKPITDWCDRRQLHFDERLRIFLEVCDAVAHAHRHLVIHRDLKPSNVLVDASGRARLLDFGIAKLLDEDGDAATRLWQPALTPDYASPEQVAGGSVTTASDVYSLGVLLHELLVDRTPFAWRGVPRAAVAERLRKELPTLPSRGLPEGAEGQEVAARRRLSRRELARRLRGDLDRILLMALRPLDNERYPSVEAFAADLRRYLAGEPVQAAGSGRLYRAQKLLQRHRLAIAAGVTTLAALLLFSILAAVQAQRAERQRSLAEAVTTLLLDAFADADPERNRGARVSAREILDAGARRLLTATPEDPELVARLSLTLGQVYSRLGLFEEARRLLDRAEATAARDELELELVASIRFARADLARATRDLETAQRSAAAAAAAWRRLDRTAETLLAERVLALAAADRGDRAVAADSLRRILIAQEQALSPADPEALRTRLELARVEVTRGEAERAEPVLETALALAEAGSPLAVEIHAERARLLLRLRRPTEAEPLAIAALAASRKIWGDRHPKVADAVHLQGAIHHELGRREEAIEAYLAALELRRQLLGPRHPDLAPTLLNIATLMHRELDRIDLAETLYREALDIVSSSLGDPHHPTLAVYLRGWGRGLADSGRPETAEPVLRRAIGILERHAETHGTSIDLASTQSALAGALIRLGRRQEASALLEQALPILTEHYGADHRITRRAAERLAATGRPAAAGGGR